MQRLIAVEESIGETRAGVVEKGRLVELHVERWSAAGARAIENEIYRGRVLSVDASLNAAFIDLGRGAPGFLPFGKAGRPKGFHQGLAVGVRVAREAHAEKGPNLALAKDVEPGEAPQCVEPAPALAVRLVKAFGEAEVMWSDEAEIDLDAAFEEALQPAAPVPGGGGLFIEPTRALTAIDIDSGGRTAQGGAQALALALNTSAVKEAARQMRLRGLGGIIAIDCAHMRAQTDRKQVEGALRQACRADRARIDVAPISQFCVLELARQRRGPSLADIMLDAAGAPSAETQALAALRRLEREGAADRRRRLILTAGEEIAAWLEDAPFDWEAALAERLGPRFDLVADPDRAPRDFDVKTAR